VQYTYSVNYAHVNENVEDVEGGIHHGTGSVEITTDTKIETQQHKDDVAKMVGRMLHEKHNVTKVAIQSITPVKTDKNV
jgi:Glu-tRNA(Gln) amidotransferase subunit E-like FAD-binding protein